MAGTSPTTRRLRPRVAIPVALTVLTALALGAMSASALAYGSTVRDGEQLLPGTTIASVPVGESSVEDATAAVRAALEPQLGRTITVTYGDLSWETTPLELGATTDLDAVVADAAAQADDLSFPDLVKLRWLGGDDGLVRDVTTTVDDDAVAAFVTAIADELDRDPRDAEVAWVDAAAVVTSEGRTGREVHRDAAVDALVEAATGDATEVELPIDVAQPSVPTEVAEQVADEVGAVADAALDRAIAVSLGDRTETVTGRDLGATPDIAPLVAAATSGDELPDVELAVSDGFTVVPERDGAAVDRAEAIEQIQAALDGAADRVGLELRTVRPAVTADEFDEVLVVDHSETTLTLYRGGQPAASWPVAVGTNDSPTPTGTFVVGAMRREPTWVNPAPDRWGKDMPARIGPGPNNPLGLRAINWNTTDGRDTLIRFHGTPNEASIGSAASNGCVRMFNRDVVELFEMVSTGMTIVSKH